MFLYRSSKLPALLSLDFSQMPSVENTSLQFQIPDVSGIEESLQYHLAVPGEITMCCSSHVLLPFVQTI